MCSHFCKRTTWNIIKTVFIFVLLDSKNREHWHTHKLVCIKGSSIGILNDWMKNRKSRKWWDPVGDCSTQEKISCVAGPAFKFLNFSCSSLLVPFLKFLHEHLFLCSLTCGKSSHLSEVDIISKLVWSTLRLALLCLFLHWTNGHLFSVHQYWIIFKKINISPNSTLV